MVLCTKKITKFGPETSEIGRLSKNRVCAGIRWEKISTIADSYFTTDLFHVKVQSIITTGWNDLTGRFVLRI